MALTLELSPEEEARLEVTSRSNGTDTATYAKRLLLSASLPGEKITVTIVKEGKEANQGIAYLDDGTMIIVDGARRWVGETVAVVVSSVLQTVAGTIIFALIHNGRD